MANEVSVRESCSSTVYETIKGSHRYTIKGLSLVKAIGPGNYISSDVFSVGGYDWTVKFYPDGYKAEGNPLYVSAFLDLVTKEADFKVAFDLTLLDQSGTEQHFTRGPNQNGPDRFNSTALCRHGQDGWPSWGYPEFFERSKLEKSNYLKEDCLVIRCNIGVVRKGSEESKAFPISVPSANLGHCFKEFLDSGIGYDVIFKIGGKEIKAHKQILAARSPVFRAQFFGPIGNPKIDVVVVKSIPLDVFQALLDFVYSESFPDWDAVKSSSCSPTILVQHLLVAADLYGIDQLKSLCEAKLCDELTAETVASTLGLAEQHNCSHLKSVCLKFSVTNKNLGAVMKSEGFGHLEKSSPALVSELLQTVATDGLLER